MILHDMKAKKKKNHKTPWECPRTGSLCHHRAIIRPSAGTRVSWQVQQNWGVLAELCLANPTGRENKPWHAESQSWRISSSTAGN
jgi:hypothetical protein